MLGNREVLRPAISHREGFLLKPAVPGLLSLYSSLGVDCAAVGAGPSPPRRVPAVGATAVKHGMLNV